MISKEKKSLNDMRSDIEDRFAQKYSVVFQGNGYKCFRFDNVFFKISGLKWKDNDKEVVVAEYADSEIAARKNIFGEDGDMYPIEDMSEEDIVAALIKEIERNQ